MSGDSRKSILRSRWMQTTVSLCIAVLLYLFISHIHLLLNALGSFANYISPVLTGVILAYILNPLSNFFENRVLRKINNQKNRHRLAVICTIAAVILLMTLLLIVLIPQLFRSTAYLVGHIGIYTDQLQKFVDQIAGSSTERYMEIENVKNFVNDILDKITLSITGKYDNLVIASVSFGKSIVNNIIAFILAVYFLLDKEKLLNGCKRLMQAAIKESNYDRAADFLSRCHSILIRYIVFDLIDGFTVGFINYVFMKIAGMPYAGLVSIVVGVTNLAPTFGPIVGCVIGAFILVLINPVQALLFIIFTILLQIFDGYIFKPKLFGASLGVSPIWILIFIIVGGRMFGVWGILLAIPMAAISDFVYKEMIIARLENRRSQMQKNQEEEEEKTEIRNRREEVHEAAEHMGFPEEPRKK